MKIKFKRDANMINHKRHLEKIIIHDKLHSAFIIYAACKEHEFEDELSEAGHPEIKEPFFLFVEHLHDTGRKMVDANRLHKNIIIYLRKFREKVDNDIKEKVPVEFYDGLEKIYQEWKAGDLDKYLAVGKYNVDDILKLSYEEATKIIDETYQPRGPRIV